MVYWAAQARSSRVSGLQDTDMALQLRLTRFNAKLPTMVLMSAETPATSATATTAKIEREPICSIQDAISQRV